MFSCYSLHISHPPSRVQLFFKCAFELKASGFKQRKDVHLETAQVVIQGTLYILGGPELICSNRAPPSTSGKPWAKSLMALYLSFLVCKLGIILMSTSWGCCEN